MSICQLTCFRKVLPAIITGRFRLMCLIVLQSMTPVSSYMRFWKFGLYTDSDLILHINYIVSNITLHILLYIQYIICFLVGLSPVTADQRQNKNLSWLPTSQAVTKPSSAPPSPQRQPAGISQVIFVLKDKEKKNNALSTEAGQGHSQQSPLSEAWSTGHSDMNWF